MKRRLASASGFTLVEVAVAITILGIALATLISLQTRLMDTYVQERNGFRGTLAAQYLITFMEIENDPPEPGSTETDLVDALRERGYFDQENLDTRLPDAMKGWKLITKVESVDYAEFEDILRRIELQIRWGNGSAEQVTLVLFMNTSIGQNTQRASG